MILLNRFRLKAIDKLNITFEELKEIESKDKKSKRLEWTRVGGYYGTLDSALKALKDYIIQEYLSTDVSEDMLYLLDDLANSYVDTFVSFEQNNDQEVYDIIKKYRDTKQLQITIPTTDEKEVLKIQEWLSKQK